MFPLLQKIFLLSGLLALIPGTGILAAEEAVSPGPPLALVSGTGKVLAVPDIAQLQVTIVTEAPQAQVAGAENAKKAEALVAAVKKFLKAGDTLKSMGYRITPLQTYGGQGQKPAITGYRASNSFQIIIKDPVRLGDLIDLAVRHGVNEIHGPLWEHSRLEALIQEASVQALHNARELAEALARSQGLKIKGLQRVSTRGRGIPYPREEGRMLAPAAGMEKVATPVEVGEQEIHASVEAVFALE
ncbi:MAG: SIMPL domain-containing protein [Desulfobacca sp.]|uniref:SIMPL domain-containing protein n=1 Tax=Desulfobacca sp. TaxID=2067990 RepID=UPI00404A37AD